MKRTLEDRVRETLFGLSVFALFGILIACGGGGGGGGGGTDTTTSNNTTNTTANNNNTTTTTGSTNGSLFPDQIFYSVADATGDALYRIKPDGTANSLFVDLPADVPNAALNEAGDRYAFFVETDIDQGAGVDLRYNLYTNTTVSTSGALRLTPQNTINDYWNFIFVGTVQFTPDGSKIIFTGARTEGEFGVYKVDTVGGNLVRIGDGEEAQLNLAGNRIVATHVIGGDGEIISFDMNGNGDQQLTNNADEDFMPQWSKDGTQIVFSTDRNSGQFDIYRMSQTGSSVTPITNTTDDEYGPSLNGDGTQVSFVQLSGPIDEYGVYRQAVTAGTPASVILSPSVGLQSYWTPNPPAGRSLAGSGSMQLGSPHRPRFKRLKR